MKNKLFIGFMIFCIVGGLLTTVQSIKQIQKDKDNYEKHMSYTELQQTYSELKTEYDSLVNSHKELEENSLSLQEEYNSLVQLFNQQSKENTNIKEALMKAGTSTEINIDVPELTDGSIGYVYIPSCNISALIKEGTSAESLANMFVGEYEYTQTLGEGNYSLFGHASDTKQYVFSSLKEIKPNDSIYIYKHNVIYKFNVGYVFNVDAEDVHILEDTGVDRATCTLVCCSEGGKRRLVVFGNLVNKQFYNGEVE